MNSKIQSKVTVHMELNGHYGKTNSMDFYLVLTLELTAFPFLTELSPPVRLPLKKEKCEKSKLKKENSLTPNEIS